MFERKTCPVCHAKNISPLKLYLSSLHVPGVIASCAECKHPVQLAIQKSCFIIELFESVVFELLVIAVVFIAVFKSISLFWFVIPYSVVRLLISVYRLSGELEPMA